MKSKIYLFVVVLIVMVQFSCQKNLNLTKTDILCSVTWKYQQYYIDYNKPETILAYSLSKQNNLIDLSKYSIRYATDGTYTETNKEGIVTSGIWKFNSTETELVLTYLEIATVKRIGNLVGHKDQNDKNFLWHSSNNEILGVMISQ